MVDFPVAAYEERILLLIRLAWRGPTPAREIVVDPRTVEQLRGARWLDGEPYSVLSVSRSGEQQIRRAVHVYGPASAYQAVRLEEDYVDADIGPTDDGHFVVRVRRQLLPIQAFILTGALVHMLRLNGYSAPSFV